MSFSAESITELQTLLTDQWHSIAPAVTRAGFDRLVEENHLRNFLLWHEEDIARRDDLGFEAVYRAKRAIDRHNQERNNFIEELDKAFVASLQPPETGLPRNTETPGMIVDRLSIMALKAYHMAEETRRADADAGHRARCAEKLARIQRQRTDLATCLRELLDDVAARRRTIAVTYQFKMYNDPALNPQLYQNAGARPGGAAR